MIPRSWWVRQIGLVALGSVYLYFGIRMLIGAYTLDNPIVFILAFFASNLVILISAVLVFGFAYRMVRAWRQQGAGAADEADGPEDDPQ